MQISREWCGFTGGESDTLRKAVGKKKVDLMEQMKPKFIEGAQKVGGATKEQAETFWAQLLDFANYCFNKSHAACYALIAYWTAYLKAHYPDAFMAALMTSDMRWTDRLAIEINESKRMGLKVLGPDINESYGDFGIVKGEKTIRFGLSGIKNMGKSLIEEIVIPERDKNGPFTSVFDFAKRINATKFNKKSWEAGIQTGAFDRIGRLGDMDDLGQIRSDLLFNLETIQGYGAKIQKDASSGQTDLFGTFGAAGEIPIPETKPAPTKMTEKEMLLAERDLMGLYLSAHPLDKYDVYFKEQTHPYSVVTPENNNRSVIIGGIITDVRTILTKKGDKMAFVKVENKDGEQELVVFPQVFAAAGAKLVQDNVIKASGRVNSTDASGNLISDAKVIVDTIELISDEMLAEYQPTGSTLPAPVAAPAKRKTWTRSTNVNGEGGRRIADARRPAEVTTEQESATPVTTAPWDAEGRRPTGGGDSSAGGNYSPVARQRLYCLVKDYDNTEVLAEIKHLCDAHPGIQEIVLVIKEDGKKRALKMPFKVDTCKELTEPLENLLGKDCVVVK